MSLLADDSLAINCSSEFLLTESRESQLSASNTSIYIAPEIITHCAPLLVVADFHTTFIDICRGSSKSQSSLGTYCKQNQGIVSILAENCYNNVV